MGTRVIIPTSLPRCRKRCGGLRKLLRTPYLVPLVGHPLAPTGTLVATVASPGRPLHTPGYPCLLLVQYVDNND